MDAHTSRRAAGWQPTTQLWGLAAYEETKVQFVDLVMNSERPRAQAYALWALSHDPSLNGRELLAFRTGCGNDQPDPEQIEKAKQAVRRLADSPPPPDPEQENPKQARKTRSSARSKGKGLSKMEKAILANFSDANKAIVAYKAAKHALVKAQRDLEKAGQQIHLVDREKAKLLAQLDPQAASVLKDLGILD